MTYLDLQRKRHAKPFGPFRIKVASRIVYEILEPWMITIGETSAIIVTQVRKDDRGYQIALDWRTVSISQILEFSDIDVKPDDRKRKPA